MQHLFFGFCNLKLTHSDGYFRPTSSPKIFGGFFEHLHIFDGYFRPTSSPKIFGGFFEHLFNMVAEIKIEAKK